MSYTRKSSVPNLDPESKRELGRYLSKLSGLELEYVQFWVAREIANPDWRETDPNRADEFGFTSSQYSVMTDKEMDFVESVREWCEETRQEPTERQQEYLESIEAMTKVRIIRRTA